MEPMEFMLRVSPTSSTLTPGTKFVVIILADRQSLATKRITEAPFETGMAGMQKITTNKSKVFHFPSGPVKKLRTALTPIVFSN